MENSFDRYDKLELMMHTVILAIILIIIAIFFWPNNEDVTQSNEFDETKIQIKVIVKRINIRKEPTIDSEDIGDVYQDEIYTVLDYVDKEDYYWYKIETNNGIVGYIASDISSSYVEIINGYIDRSAPQIIVEKDFLTFNNGEITYDDVTCIDEYSVCNLTHDDSDSRFIVFIGKDDIGNISTKKVRYYNVYDTSNVYVEDNKYVKTTYQKEIKGEKIIISAFFVLKNNILSDYKSQTYSPIITFYDEDFNEIKDVVIYYNEREFSKSCINNNDLSLKEEYLEKDLVKGDTLCIDYSFINDTNIKYFAVGFTGVENYNRDENYLANYYSRYYINY